MDGLDDYGEGLVLEGQVTDLALEGQGTEGNEAVYLRDIGRREVNKRQGAFLPHWTAEGCVYHVRFSLVDSIPEKAGQELLEERKRLLELAAAGKGTPTHEQRRRLLEILGDKIEFLLDAGHGECWLAKDPVAELVGNAIKFFEGKRYRLYAWCVMPNHVHVVVMPLTGNELAKILHSWKSFTANQANKILGRSGAFWRPEYFDRIIRSPGDLESAIQYVYSNPNRAGLPSWPWRFSTFQVENSVSSFQDKTGGGGGS